MTNKNQSSAKFECWECNYTFDLKDAIILHKGWDAYSSDNLEYYCKKCWKGFKEPGNDSEVRK